MLQPSTEHSLPFRKALPLLFLIAFVFFLIFLCRIIFSPLLPSIQLEMGFSHIIHTTYRYFCCFLCYMLSIMLHIVVAAPKHAID